MTQQSDGNVDRSVTPTVPKGELADQLAVLLQVLALREARIAKAEQSAEEVRQAKMRQRESNSATHAEKDLIRQARCTHLKGGRRGPRAQQRDYNIYLHTYINAQSIIKCCTCGMKWGVKDTVESLWRKGKKVANHTKIGWAEAQGMLQQSTNLPSSSEVPLVASSAVGDTSLL